MSVETEVNSDIFKCLIPNRNIASSQSVKETSNSALECPIRRLATSQESQSL